MEYASVSLQHHFDGFILDRIPGISWLKWRSFVFGKAYYGSLRPENFQETFLFPEGLKPFRRPYYEVGFGIENIFKIARMDFIWRLTDTDGEKIYPFIVKPSFNFSF